MIYHLNGSVPIVCPFRILFIAINSSEDIVLCNSFLTALWSDFSNRLRLYVIIANSQVREIPAIA